MAAKAEKGSLQSILENSQKKYKTNVGPLSTVATGVKVISTGNIAIDHIIGVGGIPLGRLIELYGPPSSGKTTTALQTAANLQKIIMSGGDSSLDIGPDDVIVYLDYEHAMDEDYAKALGLDTDHPSFLFAQPDTLEDGANLFRELLATGRVRLAIFDSVAQMLPSAKASAEIGKSLPAVQAKLMGDFTSALVPELYNNNCAAIFLNHAREVMEMGGGRRPGMPARITTPGGVSLKYYASLRIEYKQAGNLKTEEIDEITKEKKEQVNATNVKVKVVKNKVARPFREAIVRVRYGTGFDNFWTALQILVANKLVMYSTGYYYFHNLAEDGLAPEWMPRAATGTKRPNIRTEKNLFQAAEDHPEWAKGLIAKAHAVLQAPNAKSIDDASEDSEDEDDTDTEVEGFEVLFPSEPKTVAFGDPENTLVE